MHLGKPVTKRPKTIVLGILTVLFLWFFAHFFREFLGLFGFGAAQAQEGATQVLDFIQFPLVCFASYFGIFFLWLVLISFQAILPITNFFDDPVRCVQEVYRSMFHLMLHIFRLHGPAISIKDGKANTTREDTKRESWPGVVVIDQNSAVVLEERNPPPGIMGALIKIIILSLELLGLIDRKDASNGNRTIVPRVRGAGIVFTRPFERIRGTVDLRSQFRLLPQIKSYTRDGIELSANVFTIFTIGQKPDIIWVTYIGGCDSEHLRIVTLRDDRKDMVRITEISSELDDIDPSDRLEIHENYMGLRQAQNGADLNLYPYEPSPRPDPQPEFNADRVFAAVYAQARTSSDQKVLPWSDLPTPVAAGYYREVLSHVNYDELYEADEQGSFPLPNIKSKLRIRMRNNGILAYRLLLRRDGADIHKDPGKHKLYPSGSLLATKPIPLTNSKVLRDRGIRVNLASFGDPVPVSEEVYNKRLSAWRARWEREYDVTMAPLELNAMHEASRAHAEAQQEIYYNLSRLLAQYDHADEALALRVLQALENASTDPKTRALLPDQTIQYMRHIHDLLMPRDQLPNQQGRQGGGRL